MVNYKKIGEKIAKKRIELNMTQDQLAEKLETSASYISNIENAVYGISFERLVEIAKVLNLSYDYLLNDELEGNLKIEGNIREINRLINDLSKENQSKAFVYIENFLNTMKKLENN